MDSADDFITWWTQNRFRAGHPASFFNSENIVAIGQRANAEGHGGLGWLNWAAKFFMEYPAAKTIGLPQNLKALSAAEKLRLANGHGIAPAEKITKPKRQPDNPRTGWSLIEQRERDRLKADAKEEWKKNNPFPWRTSVNDPEPQ